MRMMYGGTSIVVIEFINFPIDVTMFTEVNLGCLDLCEVKRLSRQKSIQSPSGGIPCVHEFFIVITASYI